MKKNILYLGNYLKRNKSNPTYMITLSNHLRLEGFEILCFSEKSNKIIRLLDMVFQVFINRRLSSKVLIDTYSTQNFYYALIVSQFCRLFKLNYMPILHGGNLPNRLKNNPKLCRLIFDNAQLCVSPSFYMKEAFGRENYDNIAFIPNSIVLEDYKFLSRSFESIKILWVRSFSKIYNPKLAIYVLKYLKDQGYDAELCMIGPDSDGSLNKCREFAQNLEVEVKFTGKLTKEAWCKLSQDYNIFINTTNFDNMPVSVIEAMALGLSIVSTNVGGMPYLIQHNTDGLLVEPNNPEAMANAIIQMTKNPVKTQEMTHEARKKVEQFDWKIVKHKWLSILQ